MSQPTTWYLNLANEPAKVAIGSLLNGEAWEAAAIPSQKTTGTRTMRLVLLDDSDAETPARVVDAESIILAVRMKPSSEDLIVLATDWTLQGTSPEQYYEAEVVWDVIPGTWSTGEIEIDPIAEVIVDGRAVSIPLKLERSAYDAGAVTSNPQLYVKTTPQDLTPEQIAQVKENLEITESAFDPASPGPIGGTTPDTGEFTTLTAGSVSATNEITSGGTVSGVNGDFSVSVTIGGRSLQATSETNLSTSGSFSVGIPSGASGAVLSQDGSILSVENGAPLGASAVDGVAKVMTQSSLVSFLSNSSPTFNALTSSTISAASGTFSVGSTGDVTGTHFKAQGSGGVAGHVQLKQGTAPSGTSNETTLWGIANGIGWRNGTGTAYSLTLPTATGTLALVDGNLGTPTTLTLTNATGLPVAGGGTGATTAREARQNLGAASFRMSQIPVNDSAWSTATVSGTVSSNTYGNGARTIQIASATSGAGRANFNNGNVSSFLLGSRTQVDYSQNFAFSVSGLFTMSATTTSKALITPAASATLAATDLASKGLAIRFAGTGSVVQVMIQSHNGTSAVNSSAYTYGTQSESIADLRLVWTAGVGAYLYLDGTLICSMTTNLPSGSGTSAHTCPSLIVEDASSSTGATVRITTITVARG